MSDTNHLAGLPSRAGLFTAGHAGGPAPLKRYVPGASDALGVPLRSSPTRTLVRALRAAGAAAAPPLPRPAVPPEPAAEAAPAPARKRRRETRVVPLDGLAKGLRQACLRVALTAACEAPDPPAALTGMRDAWRANNRARFRVTRDLRAMLAASVARWPTPVLEKYMQRACEGFVVMPRAEMVAAVRFHLAPPAVYHSG